MAQTITDRAAGKDDRIDDADIGFGQNPFANPLGLADQDAIGKLRNDGCNARIGFFVSGRGAGNRNEHQTRPAGDGIERRSRRLTPAS